MDDGRCLGWRVVRRNVCIRYDAAIAYTRRSELHQFLPPLVVVCVWTIIVPETRLSWKQVVCDHSAPAPRVGGSGVN